MKTERKNGWSKLYRIIHVATVGCVLLTAGLAAGAEDLSAWQKRMPIAFSGYTPPGGGETLTNFPALVILSNTATGAEFNYNDFQSPPYGDLRFAAGDKTTSLDFEVESWVTNGLSHVWVRVPELTNNATIYALWGRSGVSAPPCITNGAVWSNSFTGVWHMTDANPPNSVAGGVRGTKSNNVLLSTGQIGPALSFANTSTIDYVNVNGTGLQDPDVLTVSAWVKLDPTSDGGVIYGHRDEATRLIQLNAQSTTEARLQLRGSAGILQTIAFTTDLKQWTHLVGVFDTLADRHILYVNGQPRIINTYDFGVETFTSAKQTIGTYNSGAYIDGVEGLLDEIRVSSSVCSSNSVWASYMNMASNGVFSAYGMPESGDLPLVLKEDATDVTLSSAWLNGTLTATGTSATAVMVFWGTTDGGTNASSWANTNTWVAPKTPGYFTIQATDLLADSTYCYRFAASNAAGWTWTPQASIFITGDVWIEKTADASEIGPTPGTFTVHRVSAATNAALIVNYTTGGTAANGTDYATLSGMVTIPAGETNATIAVLPIFDHLVEGQETVVVTLAPGPYVIGTASNATVEIADYGIVTATWDGGGANAFASTAANWLEGEAPIAGDAILLDATTNKNMTWDLNIPIQSWTQDGYVGTVTIATVYPGQGDFTNFTILGDCVISNGVWTQVANPNVTYEANRLRVTIGGNLTISSNGAIDVTGKGYSRGKGPGCSPTVNSGAAYGGVGSGNGYITDRCYGSIMAPVNLGSGGRDGNSGGGAIRLIVSGTVRNDGLMAANGTAGSFNLGSGGSLYLTAGALIGNGSFQATGGNHTGSHSTGGGGRIALVVTHAGADFSLYTGAIKAHSSISSYRSPPTAFNAGAGTVYLRTAGQGPEEGTLIVDNEDLTYTTCTDIDSNVTDAVVGNVLIRNNGYLRLRTDQTLTVGGVWSNGATFVAQSGSQVIFAGDPASTSTLYGANTFMGLICTNTGGKTLLFETGKTVTVSAGGRLTLKGSETSTNLFLRSTSPAQAWKLNVSAAAEQDVWNVDVQNSDAKSGAEVLALFSTDGGANTNWRFSSIPPGATNVWTGDRNTVWSTATNWSFNRAPLDGDYIEIPAGLTQYPAIDSKDRTVQGLAIKAGAALSLNGYNLTVIGKATLAGNLVCAGRETVTFRGDVDFTGGTFTPVSSTVMLAGDAAQTVDPAEQQFCTVHIVTTNTVTFTSGFSAEGLWCLPSGDEKRSVVFAEGETVSLYGLTLLSEVGTTNIMLRSSVDGQPWLLTLSAPPSVRGVDVKDSNAGAGRTVYASASLSSGNNDNWDFSALCSDWTGQAGNGKFDDAANWSPAGVPGASSRVRMDAENPMTITGAVSLLSLTVGGGNGLSVVTAYAPLTVIENVAVLNQGTLMLNKPSVVSNGVYVLSGGVLTHSGPQTTEIDKLDLTVFGNVGVDANGSIDVTGKGYTRGYGPGIHVVPPPRGNAGSAYGGRGSGSGPSYGSILAPTNLGSGGIYMGFAGGGAIRLIIQGTIRMDGTMGANGMASEYYVGTGGSIYMTAGELTGSGIIEANGASLTGTHGGGGGRVSLIVTNTGAAFTVYTGTIQARSSKLVGGTDARSGGAGTVYLQTAAERPGRGTVWVDNDNLTSSTYTDVPSATNGVAGEANKAVFRVANAATLRLKADFTVGDIWLDTANAVLDLGTNTLTVNAREHDLGPGSVANEGAIVWTGLAPGVLIIVK